MAKTPKRKAKQPPSRFDANARTRDDKRALQRRLRDERAIVKLSGQLERAIRQSDYRLTELGGVLLARARSLVSHGAARDVDREEATVAAAFRGEG